MQTLIASIVVLAQEAEENAPEDLYPRWEELLVGAIAFFILFFFMGRWVLPRVNRMLEERRARIQGELEKAEGARQEAEQLLARYEERLKEARGEAGRIIDEARKTAESMRRDLLAKAEEDARQVVARAQDEIRGERERAFEELRRHMGEISIDLASRVIGQSLDKRRQAQLVEEYIDDLAKSGDGNHGANMGTGDGGSRRTSKRASAKTSTKGASRKGSPSKSGPSSTSSTRKTPTRRRKS